MMKVTAITIRRPDIAVLFSSMQRLPIMPNVMIFSPNAHIVPVNVVSVGIGWQNRREGQGC